MPELYLIAGCNGAGKTTGCATLLPEFLNISEFVNADIIAARLSPVDPGKAALEAGRIMLSGINQLITEKKDFVFETTLSGKTYLSLIKRAKADGYTVTILYLWLASKEIAKTRVEERVRKGGHNIEPEVIDRRYDRGIKHLFSSYLPLSDAWQILDNTTGEYKIVAKKDVAQTMDVENPELWDKIQLQYHALK